MFNGVAVLAGFSVVVDYLFAAGFARNDNLDAALFTGAVALGREVIWLHGYGERFVDAAAGRPKGPPRMAKEIEPAIAKTGAIPPAPEPLPNTMTYAPATRRLHAGKGSAIAGWTARSRSSVTNVRRLLVFLGSFRDELFEAFKQEPMGAERVWRLAANWIAVPVKTTVTAAHVMFLVGSPRYA